MGREVNILDEEKSKIDGKKEVEEAAQKFIKKQKEEVPEGGQ